MNTKQIILGLAVASLVVGSGIFGCAPIEPAMRTGAAAEVTHDGLHRVDHAGFAAVWVKPGADVAHYDKILVASPSFHYRAVRGSRASIDSAYEVPEQRRPRFEEIVTESFTKALARSRYYSITAEPGPETLLLVTAIHDVVSHLPPRQAGRDTTYVSRIGEATIVLELRDSESNEVLARAAERRAIDPSSGVAASNAVSPASDVRREAGRWGSKLRSQLDALHERSAKPD